MQEGEGRSNKEKLLLRGNPYGDGGCTYPSECISTISVGLGQRPDEMRIYAVDAIVPMQMVECGRQQPAPLYGSPCELLKHLQCTNVDAVGECYHPLRPSHCDSAR